ncbi:unnamed protein product [Calypogeia fissa]
MWHITRRFSIIQMILKPSLEVQSGSAMQIFSVRLTDHEKSKALLGALWKRHCDKMYSRYQNVNHDYETSCGQFACKWYPSCNSLSGGELACLTIF